MGCVYVVLVTGKENFGANKYKATKPCCTIHSSFSQVSYLTSTMWDLITYLRTQQITSAPHKWENGTVYRETALVSRTRRATEGVKR